MSTAAARKNTIRRRVWKWMYDQGWTRSGMDDSLRSRIAHAVYAYTKWYDWGGPVMCLVGRNEGGNTSPPRGRDLWWIPVDMVEGVWASWLADFEQMHGCYVTRRYADVSRTSEVDWRIYDLQDEGRTVKVGRWPNRPADQGHIQPLPWNELHPTLFLRWYLWEHKAKAQWAGVRTWLYYKALHAAVNDRKPFACQATPAPGKGGYSHWHCQLKKRHKCLHRFRSYVWSDGEQVAFAEVDR